MSSTAKVAFYVQFRRSGGSIVAQKLTQTRSKTPRGSGAISIKFVAEIPTWVFDPLDLVADTVVPAENTEPIIRLSSVGPNLDRLTPPTEAEVDEFIKALDEPAS